MLVYADRVERVSLKAALQGLPEIADRTDRLIRFGQIESGISDELNPDVDEVHPLLSVLREEWIRLDPEQVDLSVAPSRIDWKTPEGFAFYALYPEQYKLAAECFLKIERPKHVVVIGIRSIGAPLSAIVAATLRGHGVKIDSFTVRPRGDPYQRRVRFGAVLLAQIRAYPPESIFAIVDEGPGISGSSFASVAQALVEAGITGSRIVFFPAWNPSPDRLRSLSARQHWDKTRKYCARFEDLGIISPEADDWSGVWRSHLFAGEDQWPASHPQHERRKYRLSGILAKFAGLGGHGREKLVRADRLSAAGFCSNWEGIEHGFALIPFQSGEPVVWHESSESFLNFAMDYFRFTDREMVSDRAAQPLRPMVEINVEEALGEEGRRLLRHWREPEVKRPLLLDNRVLPHEWLKTPHGYLKTDCVDHADDHFYPGPHDLAWDVAGFCAEFRLSGQAKNSFVERLCPSSRLPDFEVAYLAFRTGYCSLAAETVSDASERERFITHYAGYRGQLRSTLDRLQDRAR